jgi:hypothetical protein
MCFPSYAGGTACGIISDGAVNACSKSWVPHSCNSYELRHDCKHEMSMEVGSRSNTSTTALAFTAPQPIPPSISQIGRKCECQDKHRFEHISEHLSCYIVLLTSICFPFPSCQHITISWRIRRKTAGVGEHTEDREAL